MTPREKVTSFETSKRLKELGFPQDTERVWVQSYVRTQSIGEDWKIELGDWKVDQNRKKWLYTPEVVFEPCHKEMIAIEKAAIAAPDAQEIGALLPFRNKRMGTLNDARFAEFKLPNQYVVGFVDEDNMNHPFDFLELNGFKVRFNNENEAEARAALWIWLKENKLI